MLETLTRFAECCRAWDLRVSTSEVLDCASHLALVDLSDERLVKTIFKADFAKSRRDQKKFDQIYELFFHIIPINTSSQSTRSLKPKMKAFINSFKKELNQDKLDTAMIDFIAGKPELFLAIVREEHEKEEIKPAQFKSNLSQLTGKLKMMLASMKLEKSVSESLLKSGMTDREKAFLTENIQESFESARIFINTEVGYFNDSLDENSKKQPDSDSLSTTPFASLNEDEIYLMNQELDRLVRKLKDKVARRQAVKNKGVLDVKQTLRQANKFQGFPVKLCFKDKALKKANIVTLCDVSGSVWSTARFMLHLLYALQECFSRVKSFVFVSDLAEVTQFFKNEKINQAIDLAMQKADINYHAQTDYGAAFQEFHDRHTSLLDRKTTLIILGDGRSNYHNPKTELLSFFREKVKRIIWLNPETSATWYTGDSEIRSYRQHCHGIYTCMNLTHLSDIIQDLVL